MNRINLEKIKNKKNLIIISIIIVVTVISFFLISTKQKSTFLIKNNDYSKIKIVKNAASKLVLEEYKTDIFTMKKPKDWIVDTAGSGMYYTIKVYNPNDTNNCIFLMLKIQPLLKSEAAKNIWQEYYQLAGNNYRLFADAVVLDNPTTEGFYQKFNEIGNYINNNDPLFSNYKFPVYNNFIKQEEHESNASMKNFALDSKVLRARFTGENNKKGEGLFLASIVNFGNQYNNGIDFSYYMIYDIMTITSNENEFIDYKDILLKSINSIEFTSEYVKKTIDDGNAQTKQSLELNASLQKAFSSYMSAWENRNKTYDIMSQKQSDATLGYERVYNIDTGDIYKAYNGFTDDYTKNEYQKITDDMYTEKTTGYIEKIK